MNLAKYYDQIYTEEPLLWTRRSEARNKFAFEALQKPATLLDLGCGIGETIAYFESRWNDVKYYGVDVSSVAIELAKKKVPSATFICGLIDDVQVKADLTMLMGVAEHFENLDKLKDLPDGIVYLEIPNCLKYAQSKEEGFRREGRQYEWHLKRETWEQVLLDNGFETVQTLTGLHPAWEFIWVLRH